MGVSPVSSKKMLHQIFKSASTETQIENGLAGKKSKNVESNMNNHEEYNDCKTQLEQIYKIKVNGMKI